MKGSENVQNSTHQQNTELYYAYYTMRALIGR